MVFLPYSSCCFFLITSRIASICRSPDTNHQGLTPASGYARLLLGSPSNHRMATPGIPARRSSISLISTIRREFFPKS